MAIDANQLQALCDFLRAGDGDSVRKCIETLNPSSFAEQSRINYQRIIIQYPLNNKLNLRGLIALHGLTGSKIESVLI